MTEHNIFHMTGVCDRCGDVFEATNKSLGEMAAWRWNGENWEHKCPDDHYTMGHAGRLIGHELAAALKRVAELETMLQQIADLLPERSRLGKDAANFVIEDVGRRARYALEKEP